MSNIIHFGGWDIVFHTFLWFSYICQQCVYEDFFVRETVKIRFLQVVCSDLFNKLLIIFQWHLLRTTILLS